MTEILRFQQIRAASCQPETVALHYGSFNRHSTVIVYLALEDNIWQSTTEDLELRLYSRDPNEHQEPLPFLVAETPRNNLEFQPFIDPKLTQALASNPTRTISATGRQEGVVFASTHAMSPWFMASGGARIWYLLRSGEVVLQSIGGSEEHRRAAQESYVDCKDKRVFDYSGPVIHVHLDDQTA